MRLSILAAGTALLLCTTAAIAQNATTTAPAASPSATSSSPLSSTETKGATGNNAAPLRDNIRAMMQQSGFSDIRIMPSSFMIRAKDQNGNPVIMSVSPD
jgi:hypothetical protein